MRKPCSRQLGQGREQLEPLSHSTGFGLALLQNINLAPLERSEVDENAVIQSLIQAQSGPLNSVVECKIPNLKVIRSGREEGLGKGRRVVLVQQSSTFEVLES